MISLDEIQLLEQKVEAVVTKLLQVTEEKKSLTQRCFQLESENHDLRNKISSFEKDQERIEQGIIKALDRLNIVENSVLKVVTSETNSVSVSEEVEHSVTQSYTNEDVYTSEKSSISDEILPEARIQPDTSTQVNDNFPPVFSGEIISEENYEIDDSVNDVPNENIFSDTQDYNSGQLDIF